MNKDNQTAEETASELILAMLPKGVVTRKNHTHAKKCALILCKEMLEERLNFREEANSYNNGRIKFWQSVEAEIKKP